MRKFHKYKKIMKSKIFKKTCKFQKKYFKKLSLPKNLIELNKFNNKFQAEFLRETQGLVKEIDLLLNGQIYLKEFVFKI